MSNTTKVKQKNRESGSNETAEVFEVANNELNKIGEVKWCTASTKGDTSEVMDLLLQKKKECMILGFARAKQLNKTKYVGVHQLKNYEVIPYHQWKEQVMV